MIDPLNIDLCEGEAWVFKESKSYTIIVRKRNHGRGPSIITSLERFASSPGIAKELRELQRSLVQSQFIVLHNEPPWTGEVNVVGLALCSKFDENDIAEIKANFTK